MPPEGTPDPSRLVAMSSTTGFCFLCGTEHPDLTAHFSSDHPTPSAPVEVVSKTWKQQLSDIAKAIEEISQESDVDAQIHKLDVDVIQELYLVRARLTQSKRTPALRNKEG
jgi:hypothetical protein